MISKNKLRFVVSLHQKKEREEQGLFLIEGEKLVNELLLTNWKIHSLYVTEAWINQNREKLQNRDYETITEQELEKMSSLKTPNQALSVVHIPKPGILGFDPESGLVLALDEIRDPGNLGTIVRLADWFGIRQILCSAGTVELYNPKTVQATMGSIFRVQVSYGNLPEMLQAGKNAGYRINAAILHGNNIYQIKRQAKEIVLLGNESRGISPSLLAMADRKVSIPAHPDWSGAESLNVSMAAAVLCSEFSRNELGVIRNES